MKKYIFAFSFLVICLLPFAGKLVYKEEASSENRTLAPAPSIKNEDGSININILSDAGDYFQDHFAFRPQMVSVNARINSLMGVSSDDSVIKGREDWLYYMDSLGDYTHSNILSERELFNIAHSLSMTQKYLNHYNIDFVYVPVPNKNSIYGDNMPYYYKYSLSDEKNLTSLYEYLDEEGVNYINLYKEYTASADDKDDILLYHATDSHWTNIGASMAYEDIMEALGRKYTDYSSMDYEVRDDFSGDLEGMLYPWLGALDTEAYFDKEYSYTYTTETESNFDPKINTSSPNGQGHLIMYRDSFGNALLPFMAEDFETAYFSRVTPYALSDLSLYPETDTVIMERAERFLEDTAKSSPLFPNPGCKIPQDATEADCYTVSLGESRTSSDASLTQNGKYYILKGQLDPDLDLGKGEIYLTIDQGDRQYQAIPVTIETDGVRNPNGYQLYMESSYYEKYLNSGKALSIHVFI